MCVSPRLVRVKGCKYQYMIVPCRKCVECLKQEQNDWMVRLVEEFRNFDKVLFITLTYREETIPKVYDQNGEFRYSCCKKHVQNWLKRYRIREERAGYSEPWKYFVASEYSPIAHNHWRAHYHLLIYGKSPTRFWSALCEWREMYGFFKYDLVVSGERSSVNVSRYVSKYCCKGKFEKPVWEFGDALHHPEKPFRLVSKGLGSSYCDRMRSFHTGELYNSVFPKVKEFVRLHGSEYPIFSDEFLDYVVRNRVVHLGDFDYHMPRYYTEKIYKTKVVHEYESGFKDKRCRQILFRPSPLSEQVSDFLLEAHMCDLDSKLRQLQADNPGWSTFEAYHALRRQEISDLDQRQRDANKALISFYRKAKL